MDDTIQTPAPDQVSDVADATNTFDIDKLTDEQKAKIAETLKVKYFEENKSLKEFKTKIQAEKEEAEKRKLEEEGRYKELAEIHQSKVTAYKTRLAITELKNALTEKGVSKGALSLALSAYQDKIVIDDNDNITNLESIVAELETNSPEIFTKPKTTFNTPASPVVNSSQPMPHSQWSQLSSEDKIKVRDSQGVDYSR